MKKLLLALLLVAPSIAFGQSITPSPSNPLADTHYDDTYTLHLPYTAVTNTAWRAVFLPPDTQAGLAGLGIYHGNNVNCATLNFSWGTGVVSGNSGFTNGGCSALGENGDVQNNFGDSTFASIVGNWHVAIYHFATSTANSNAQDCVDNGYAYCVSTYGSPVAEGTYDFEIFGCTDSGATNYDSTATYDDGSCTYPSSPPPSAGLADELTAADSGFASTTGFHIAGVTDWAGDNLIKLFIGSGLGLLLNLRFWIIAMLIISAIIFFAYRAFRFFRH